MRDPHAHAAPTDYVTPGSQSTGCVTCATRRSAAIPVPSSEAERPSRRRALRASPSPAAAADLPAALSAKERACRDSSSPPVVNLKFTFTFTPLQFSQLCNLGYIRVASDGWD